MAAVPDELPEFATRFEPGEPARRGRTGAMVGAVAAVLASGGLAWWLSAGDRTVDLAAGVPPRSEVAGLQPAAPRASTTADAEQVRRAYDQARTTYADGGAPALVQFSQECSETLAGDPRILDFCLAFDLYAAAMAPDDGPAADWFGVGEARRLRLTEAALPAGADAPARLTEVQGLMRQVNAVETPPSTVTPAAPPPAQRVSRPAPPAKRPASQCGLAPTPADRMLCASPELRAADRRMLRAYRQAVEAGANREILEGEQSAWRVLRNRSASRAEMADAYARRMRELEQHVAQAARTEPAL